MRFLAEPPTEDEVRQLADALGYPLSPAEGRVVAVNVRDVVDLVESLDVPGLEEERPAPTHRLRTPGRRPSADEDPYNAFITTCRVEGAPDGPLAGVEVALKDHVAVAGVPLTFGWRPMAGFTPDFDATIVTRLLDAGGTIVGKLNMDQLSMCGAAFGGVSDYGRVKNPRNPDHLTAGSSSGAGAAVASGQVDAAIGGDQGGSVRMPAAWCGVVGIKPTFGLVPHSGVFGAEPSIDHVGPLARTVELTARVLGVLAGPDGQDPRQRDVPAPPDYTAGLDGDAGGIRLGVLEEGFAGGDADPVVRDAIDRLASAGATAESVSVPQHSAGTAIFWMLLAEGTRRVVESNLGGAFARTHYPADLIAHFGRLRESHGRELPTYLKTVLLTAAAFERRHHGAVYARGQNLRGRLAALYDAALESVDVLVMPTMAGVAPPYQAPADAEEAFEQTLLTRRGRRVAEHIGFNLSPFNATGHPAISVPCGSLNGLPVGLQLVGRHFDEARLLRVASAVEAVAAESTPPVGSAAGRRDLPQACG